MSAYRPETHLETHDVTNQPPPFEDVNLFTSRYCAARGRGGRGRICASRAAFGFRREAGTAQVAEWAMQANKNPPQLKTFDRYGQRIDEVEFHPAYHELMALGLDDGIAACAWQGLEAGHVLHTALEFMMAQAEPGVCCPMTMTYAALPALRHQPDVAAIWEPRIVASNMTARSLPADKKNGVTIGMAMTEKQGGSDVRANTTQGHAQRATAPTRLSATNGSARRRCAMRS